MVVNDKQHRAILQRIARKSMLENGLLPDFSTEALAELDRARALADDPAGHVRDLSDLLWSSIDNDDSLDLDQLTVAEEIPRLNFFSRFSEPTAPAESIYSSIMAFKIWVWRAVNASLILD